MKKRLTVFLVAILLIVAAGCSNNEASSNNTNSSNTSEGGKENSGETIKIALGSVTSETSPFHVFLTKFKEEVDKNSNGQIEVSLHPNGELGGDREMIEAVQIGSLDGVISSSAVLGNFTSLVNVLDFPFLFRDQDHAYKVLDGEIGDEIAAAIEGSGLKLIAWPENGFRNITNSQRPIKSLEDIKDLKIRTQENKVIVDSFTEYGASPTPMSFTEVFSALQQGVVDGQENPLSIVVSSKLYEVQKYLTISNHLYGAAPFTMNKELFDGLSPELQKVIQDAAYLARDHQRQYIADMDAEFLKEIEAQGMEIVQSEDFDRKGFEEASEEIYKKYEKEYGDIIQRIKDTE